MVATIGSETFTFEVASTSIRFSGIRVFKASERAVYSASSVEDAILVCREDLQVTGQPASLMTNPVRDLTEVGSASGSTLKSPQKSASTNISKVQQHSNNGSIIPLFIHRFSLRIGSKRASGWGAIRLAIGHSSGNKNLVNQTSLAQIQGRVVGRLSDQRLGDQRHQFLHHQRTGPPSFQVPGMILDLASDIGTSFQSVGILDGLDFVRRWIREKTLWSLNPFGIESVEEGSEVSVVVVGRSKVSLGFNESIGSFSGSGTFGTARW
ncbi:unnamed protein product [Cylindrotheca closterium]|uniref:Uncharacterized protein n=1 Tax=Cylindrotheca closterium TaxID=2856 RepID=A0AAD2G1W0_9STRA|nr:unnamed protein product [Cylindrotheca closterium]